MTLRKIYIGCYSLVFVGCVALYLQYPSLVFADAHYERWNRRFYTLSMWSAMFIPGNLAADAWMGAAAAVAWNARDSYNEQVPVFAMATFAALLTLRIVATSICMVHEIKAWRQGDIVGVTVLCCTSMVFACVLSFVFFAHLTDEACQRSTLGALATSLSTLCAWTLVGWVGVVNGWPSEGEQCSPMYLLLFMEVLATLVSVAWLVERVVRWISYQNLNGKPPKIALSTIRQACSTTPSSLCCAGVHGGS